MLAILTRLFTEDQMLRSKFVAKRFKLTTTSGETILPQFWDMTIEPGMKINVRSPPIVVSRTSGPVLGLPSSSDSESVVARDEGYLAGGGEGALASSEDDPFQPVQHNRYMSGLASDTSSHYSSKDVILGPIGGTFETGKPDKPTHPNFSNRPQTPQKSNDRVQSPEEARKTEIPEATAPHRTKYQFEADSSEDDEVDLDQNLTYLSGAANRLKHLAKAQGMEVEAQNKNLAALWDKVSRWKQCVGYHLLTQTSPEPLTLQSIRKSPGEWL
jgi:hypothetical protein